MLRLRNDESTLIELWKGLAPLSTKRLRGEIPYSLKMMGGPTVISDALRTGLMSQNEYLIAVRRWEQWE